MTNHVKPSIEELKANIQNSLKDLEAPKDPIPEVVEEKPVEEVEVVKPVEPVEEVVVKPEDEEVPVVEEKPVEEVEVVKPGEPDYKKKFIDSTREAQILQAKDAKINEAIEKSNNLPTPTEDEMKVEFPEWDVMSDLEKRLATDNVKTRRALSLLGEVTKESKDIEAWHKTVDTFVEDPKVFIEFPDLEGKGDEFKEFASKKSRRGVDLKTLVTSFLWEADKAKIKHKGSMFPVGTGGSKEKPVVKTKLTIEEGARLRESNYPEFVKQLRAGKIEMTVV